MTQEMTLVSLMTKNQPVRCRRCGWIFCCPYLQLHYRHFCRACEEILELQK
jgi:hypothetical protein